MVKWQVSIIKRKQKLVMELFALWNQNSLKMNGRINRSLAQIKNDVC